MARISKPPEVRRQEILDTAMELFAEKGYEDTSMADIARRMGVVQGLCYRYFDSKRVLFREAMEQYVRECCAAGLPIIHDRSRTIRQRLDDMAGGAPPALCRPDSGAGILNNASEARGRASEAKNFHSNEQNSMNKIQ